MPATADDKATLQPALRRQRVVLPAAFDPLGREIGKTSRI